MFIKHSEFYTSMNVFNLHLLSTPKRLCPFIPIAGIIMNNADYFKDRRVRERRLSPSHTDRISDCPYTSTLGIYPKM